MLQLLVTTAKGRVVAAAAVLGIVVLAFALFTRSGAKEQEKAATPQAAVEVSAARAVTEPLVEYSEATGTVRSASEAQIAPKIMSNIAAVYVREGDHVTRGQVLVKLEAADLSAEVSQASAALSAAGSQSQAARRSVTLQESQSSVDIARAGAELNAARQQLIVAQTGPRKQERSQAHLAVAQAKAQYKNADVELGRMKSLFSQDAISKQRVDQAEMGRDVAKAQLDAAEQQADLVEEGSRQEDIRTAQARVTQAEESLRMARAAVVQNKIREEQARAASSEVGRASAGLTLAKVLRGYATIQSPMNGIVTARLVDPGTTVSPGVPMMTIEDNSRYRLDAAIGESDLPYVSVGSPVQVQVDSANLTTVGKVAQIVPSGDPGSRKFTVKVELPAGVKVKTGQFGRIRFPKGRHVAVTVPDSAVQDSTGLTSVLVVGSDQVARQQVVKVGKSQLGRTEITSGLSGDELVVTAGASGVSDGTLVRIR